jgi:hypothetical protein
MSRASRTLRRAFLGVGVLLLVLSLALFLAVTVTPDRATAVLGKLDPFTPNQPTPTLLPTILPISSPTFIPASPTTTIVIPVTPTVRPTGTPRIQPSALPTTAGGLALDTRIVEVEYPKLIRLGNSDVIKLSLQPYTTTLSTTTVQVTVIQPNRATETKTYKIPDLYAEYDIVAHPRLIMPSQVTVLPASELEAQQIIPGEELNWSWVIQPDQPGIQSGVIYLTIEYNPVQTGSQPVAPKQLELSPITITIVTVFGLTAEQTKYLGLGGSILGISSIVGAIDLLDRIRKFLQGTNKPTKPTRKRR